MLSDEEYLKERTLPRKILFIEDDQYIREVFCQFAENWDCRFFACGTGQEGVEWVMREQFDVLFLDMGLPDMSGYDVLKDVVLLRPKMDVVIVSGRVDGDMIDRVMDLTFALFVQKPKGFRLPILAKLFYTLGIDTIPSLRVV